MQQFTKMKVILCALALASCGDRAAIQRIETIGLDRAQLATCLQAAWPVAPDVPAYEIVTLDGAVPATLEGRRIVLPAGLRVLQLDQVRERDAIAGRFIVELGTARALCAAAVRYADEFTLRMEGGQR